MPVYLQSRLVHIHVPKTGGTAVERFFHSIGDMRWGRESWVGEERIAGRWYELQHLSMSELSHLSRRQFTGFPSFAVLRNPYSRVVSEFLWRRALSQARPESTLGFQDFREFLYAIPNSIDHDWSFLSRHGSQTYVNFLIHVRPQYQFVCDREGRQVVDQLLSFERLRAEFSDLIRGLGLEPRIVRSPPERNALAFFDRAMLNRVNEIYFKDFILGAYEMV
jgi:hypothetical protein